MAYAIQARTPGGTEVMSRVEITPPQPGPGEVLIRQAAVGVNFIDIYIRTGLYPWPVDQNLTLGCEGAGVVEALGEGVTGFSVGQRVAYTVPNGAYATHRVVPAAMLLALPDGVSDVQAAGAMLKGLTAYYLLHNSYPVKAGDTVLFHAAAGGVGLLAGQWLAAKGVTAIGTAGGPEKCALAAENGYADVIDYRSEDFVERTRQIAPGGLPVVYDSVGKDTMAGSLQLLAPLGTLVTFGQSSGPYTDFNVSDLAKGSNYLQRPTLFTYAARRSWLEEAGAALFAAIADGTLTIKTTERPLEDVAAVHDALEGRKSTGSFVLIP